MTPPTNGAVSDLNRPPRLPRWTRQEILVLIQGKRVVETRVRRGGGRAHQVGGGAQHQVEPKWASVAAYCRRHGVNRGPVQCRKRWSNLAGDYKKIKEWESRISDESDSFWVMRNDSRRERRLPGFFDREVYEILDAKIPDPNNNNIEEEEDGVNSDMERSKEEEDDDDAIEAEGPQKKEEEGEPALPLLEKECKPTYQECSNRDKKIEHQPTPNLEKGSTSYEGQKRRRVSSERGEVTTLQDQLVEIMERNGRTLTSQLEAQNINCQLDRDQRKDHAESLIGVLSKVADALGRIADKL